jgi:quercetin dioxygenase-like cupin family protein
MKKITLAETREFNDKSFSRFLLHDSPYFRVLNFNLKAGQVFPVHSHPADGQLTIQVIEGDGDFLADNGGSIPAQCGDILVSDISEPHGVKAHSDMRIVVTIAPPF